MSFRWWTTWFHQCSCRFLQKKMLHHTHRILYLGKKWTLADGDNMKIRYARERREFFFKKKGQQRRSSWLGWSKLHTQHLFTQKKSWKPIPLSFKATDSIRKTKKFQCYRPWGPTALMYYQSITKMSQELWTNYL